MELPGGDWLVWLAGGGVLIYAGYQLYRAYAAKLGRQLDLTALASGIRHWVIGLSRAGIAARGIVFGFIGVLLIRTSNQACTIRGRREEFANRWRCWRGWVAGPWRWWLSGWWVRPLRAAPCRYRRIRVT